MVHFVCTKTPGVSLRVGIALGSRFSNSLHPPPSFVVTSLQTRSSANPHRHETHGSWHLDLPLCSASGFARRPERRSKRNCGHVRRGD
jgi:hypothetical protein